MQSGGKEQNMATMKARVLTDVGALELKEVEIPKLKSGEVLLRVRACGICGSDIPRIFTTGTYHFPTIPGHEFAGEIADVFDDGDRELIGRRCAVFPLIPCRECNNCKKGNFELCSHYNYLGSRCDGAFAEYVAVPKWNLQFIPDNLSFDCAAMTEPAAVGVHALRRAGIEIGDTVAIFGPGTIGMMIAQWARAWGAGKVLLIGTDINNVEFIHSLGFYDYCNADREDPIEWINQMTGGIGASVAIDAVGVLPTFLNCLNCAAPSGKVICVGNPHGDYDIPKDTYWKILRKQLRLYGTWNSGFDGSDSCDWNVVINAMASGSLQCEKMITQKYTLEDMDKGLEIMKNGTEFFSKIIVNP